MENARSEIIFQVLKQYFNDTPDNLLLEITERLQKGQPLGSLPELKIYTRALKPSFRSGTAEKNA